MGKANIKNILRFVSIVLLATILRIIIQIIHGADPLAKVLTSSSLVQRLGEPAIAGPAILLTYFLLALIFVKIQKNLSGKKFQKGLLYGGLFGLLWFFGMIEGHIEMAAPLIAEIIFGLLETIPIITMSLLLAISFAEDSRDKINLLFKKYDFMLVSCIAFFYVAGRYFLYTIIGVNSTYSTNFIPISLWVISNGIIIGSMYYFLSHKITEQSYIKKALVFSFIVFGTDWLLFNLFAPLLFNISFFDIIWRPIVDIFFIFFGIMFYEIIIRKKSNL